jgi:hypothetical protein
MIYLALKEDRDMIFQNDWRFVHMYHHIFSYFHSDSHIKNIERTLKPSGPKHIVEPWI